MSKYSATAKSEQLLRLSDQVNRVAQSLAELATGDGATDADFGETGEMDVSQEAVAGLIRPHAIENSGGRRKTVPQAFGEIGIHAFVFFFERNGQCQDLPL